MLYALIFSRCHDDILDGMIIVVDKLFSAYETSMNDVVQAKGYKRVMRRLPSRHHDGEVLNQVVGKADVFVL